MQIGLGSNPDLGITGLPGGGRVKWTHEQQVEPTKMKMGQQVGGKLRKQLTMREHKDSEAESQRVTGHALEHLSVSGDMIVSREFVVTPQTLVLMCSLAFFCSFYIFIS